MNLRKKRIAKGLSQSALGGLVCINQVIISHLERGERKPTAEQKERLEEVLGEIEWEEEAPTHKKFLRDTEAAEIYGFAVQTLRNWRFKGDGPPYFKIQSAVRYKVADLDSFMESYRVSTDQGGHE